MTGEDRGQGEVEETPSWDTITGKDRWQGEVESPTQENTKTGEMMDAVKGLFG